MSDEKRKCIFTGEPADFHKTVTYADKHNWAKKVPCTKKWFGEWEKNGERPLNKLEFKLVELFYEQELAKLRVANLEDQMDEIRLKLEEKTKLPTTDEYLAALAQEVDEDDECPEWTKAIKEMAATEHETIHINNINDIPSVSEEDMKMIEDFFEIHDEPEELIDLTDSSFLTPPLIPEGGDIILVSTNPKPVENKGLTEEKNDDIVEKDEKDNLWG